MTRQWRPVWLLAIIVLTGCPPAIPLSNLAVVDVRAPDGRPEIPDQPSYGYVVFNYQPDGSSEHDLAVCQRIFSYLAVRPAERSVQTAPTYWPTSSYVPPARDNCEKLLNTYDSEFAGRIIKSLEGGSHWQVFLYAQAGSAFETPSRERNVTTPRLCFDLTQLRDRDNPARLDAALDRWRAFMSGGPGKWQPSGFGAFVDRVLNPFGERGYAHVDCKR
jgi:hypothetical protein